MTLDELYTALSPLLEGHATVSETAPKLYGEGWRESPDARRLGIYAEFCAQHRLDALAHVFTDTAGAIARLRGPDAWPGIVAAYFAAHPMHHVELNENGASFATFLGSDPANPAWLAELADLEWWEWQTRIAPRADADASSSLRLSSTVEVRPYHFDFIHWLDSDRANNPIAGEILVVFWRDSDDGVRREKLSASELRVLTAVANKTDVADADRETRDDLTAAGILVASR